ncbi:hypothetical protein IFT48_02300 [Pseudomonas fluorescens]|uniref:hypothetical protein n=1 Tax=Pseudomonas fluorescens TaxID=294 RepID=UPI001930A144|nr:hypothetical protein [Pseudomonas fluorescens]MBD8088795.1 hypothetical protein [Pseudomonas fluorescens]
MTPSLLNYGPDRIGGPLTQDQIYYIHQHQLWIKDGLADLKFTCRQRHDSYHGEEGGDMGLLLADEQGLACPYCDFRQPEFHSALASLPSITYAAISIEDIDHLLVRARHHHGEYSALNDQQGGSALIQGALCSLEARIAELELRKQSAGVATA